MNHSEPYARHAERDANGHFRLKSGPHLLPDREGMALSPRDWECLRAYALTANYKLAAASLGIQMGTFRQHMHRANMRLGVEHAIDAFRLLGWLKVPE